MATNSLKFCLTCSGMDLALGAAGFEFAAGVGCIYTRSAEGGTSSGLFLGCAVALGSKSMGLVE